MPAGQTFSAPQSNRVRLVVASSVMLTFISFWRAAAVVLNDLGSSAFYAGGIAEEAVGKAAPWFILGVMLFSFAVRAVYVESCSMFTRGGVYRVVKEALGGTFAKLSVSALMFDYILTGPISGVSAGQTINETGADRLTLKLAQDFAATISGFGTGDTIDATNFVETGTTYNFVENLAGTGGTLTLTDTAAHLAAALLVGVLVGGLVVGVKSKDFMAAREVVNWIG